MLEIAIVPEKGEREHKRLKETEKPEFSEMVFSREILFAEQEKVEDGEWEKER